MSIDWQPPSELPDLRRTGIVSLDTETRDDGLRADHGPGWPWRGGYICGVSVAYHVEGSIRAHYFPLRHPDTANLDPEQVFQWLRDLIASDVRFVTQRGLYDWGWLRADADITMPPPGRLEEIGALATMVDENRYTYNLDDLCTWRGLPGKDETLLLEGCRAMGLIPKGRKKFNPQEHIHELPARFIGAYAEQDAASTLALFESLDPILDQEKTRGAYRLEIDLLPMVHEMRRRGIRIDQSAAERARDLILQKRDAALAELSEKIGAPIGMDEIASPTWKARTFDTHAIKYPRTKKGNPSFKAGKTGWMSAHPHWLPQLIATANKYDAAGSKFLEGHILTHLVKGRIHSEIHPHRSDEGGTISSRFSYSDPPLQQMPSRDKELAPLIRGVFLPEEGEIWAKPDLSQQEFRLLVHYAALRNLPRAKEAAELYRNDPNADYHAMTADTTGLERDRAKSVNFAKIYGAGVEKFAEMIGKTLHEAQRIYAQYDRTMPFLSRLSKICQADAKRLGYTELYDGARRHWNRWEAIGAYAKGVGPCEFEEAKRRSLDPKHPWFDRWLRVSKIHTALNALIQGSAARHTKLWMRACWREGIVPLVQMHDALECSVSSREQAELVARLGCEAVRLEVPMRVDLKYGHNWGDAKHTWEELHGEIEAPRANGPAPARQSDAKATPEPEILQQNSQTPPWEEPAKNARPDLMAHVAGIIAKQLDELDRRRKMHTTTFNMFEKKYPPPPKEEKPASGNGQGDFSGFADGSETEAAQDIYAEEHAGEPFDDAYLRRKGYRRADVFDYMLADGTLLYQHNRYELKDGHKPAKDRPRKRFLTHRTVNGKDILGAGDRRVIYNWPAIMRASPGSNIFIPEGENKAKILIDAGLLATTVLSHVWAPECVAALTGHHLFILADHDKDGEKLASAAQKKLAPVAVSTRIVPAAHLWKHLPGDKQPKPHDDVKDWVDLGGDPAKLLNICREIPADGIITAEPYQFRDEAGIAPGNGSMDDTCCAVRWQAPPLWAAPARARCQLLKPWPW
jgi:DNA polymerase I-like protein with 3'-5' exonuclease and polymerase domains